MHSSFLFRNGFLVLTAGFYLGLISPTFAAGAGPESDARPGTPFHVALEGPVFDPREPATGDILDCPSLPGPCEAVLFPRVESDEKIAFPGTNIPDALRYLVLKGIRVQGGDPLLTLGLLPQAAGDSVYVDLNNDENLGNDGAVRYWPRGDSCLTLGGGEGKLAPIRLCRAGAKVKAWQAQCEGLKGTIPWAMCNEPAYRVRLRDMALGKISLLGKMRRIGICDLDGDGRFLLGAGDRFLLDWDGDGIVGKSLDADGFTFAAGNQPFRFSIANISYELVSIDPGGSFLELKRLDAFEPTALAAKAVEGHPAPDFRFINLDGDSLSLHDFRGKKVLIQFWSTLCKPCLDQLPGVRDFEKSFRDKNWQVISLTAETDLPEVQQAVLKYHMDWMVGMAGPEIRAYYQGHPLPLNVKINETGILEKKGVSFGKRAF